MENFEYLTGVDENIEDAQIVDIGEGVKAISITVGGLIMDEDNPSEPKGAFYEILLTEEMINKMKEDLKKW